MDFNLAAVFPVLFCLFVIALFISAAVLGYLRSQKRNAAWQELASRNGLRFEPGGMLSYPSVSGMYRGRNLLLKNIRRSHGKKNSKTYTRLVISLENHAGVQFGLYEENVLSGLGQALGMQDVRTGDETVDKRFIIKSQPEEFALRLFTSPGLRERLLQIQPINLTIKDNELTFEQRGMLSDVDRLQFLLHVLTEVAEHVDNKG